MNSITKMQLDTLQFIDPNRMHDADYVLPLLNSYIHNFSDDKNNSEYAYYYQYECDNNKTIFETLMYFHLISIKARSLEEASYLSYVLRCLIDRNFYILDYLYEDDSPSIHDSCKKIADTDLMSQYGGYRSKFPLGIECSPKDVKSLINHIEKEYFEQNDHNILSMFNGWTVCYDGKTISDLLKDPLLLTYMSSDENHILLIKHIISNGIKTCEIYQDTDDEMNYNE